MASNLFAAPRGWRTPGEVAELLGVSVQSVRGLIYSGPLLGQVHAGLLCVAEESVAAFVSERARW